MITRLRGVSFQPAAHGGLPIKFIMFLVVFCSGCILPVPHQRVHVYGVTGQIVSAADHTPIAGALVIGEEIPAVTAHSDAKGTFWLRPVRGWHGAYFVGPITLSLLPDWDMTYPGRGLRVSAPGYAATSFVIDAYPRTNSPAVAAKLVGAYLHAGQLRLVPCIPEGFGCQQHD